MCLAVVQQPFLELVALAGEPLDLGLHAVHVGDERAVQVRLAVDVDLEGAFALLDLHVAGLQQLVVLLQSARHRGRRSTESYFFFQETQNTSFIALSHAK